MILHFQFALQHIMITAKTTANMLLNNHLITRKHAIIEHRKKRKHENASQSLGKLSQKSQKPQILLLTFNSKLSTLNSQL